MTWEVRSEVRTHTNWSHAWPAAAMRYAERFVQVEVADIRAKISGPRETNKRIQIGTIEIDLTAMRMGDVADLPHPFLEHTMG